MSCNHDYISEDEDEASKKKAIKQRDEMESFELMDDFDSSKNNILGCNSYNLSCATSQLQFNSGDKQHSSRRSIDPKMDAAFQSISHHILNPSLKKCKLSTLKHKVFDTGRIRLSNLGFTKFGAQTWSQWWGVSGLVGEQRTTMTWFGMSVTGISISARKFVIVTIVMLLWTLWIS
jgi:hypothetical protein